jgi:hypothetical protein
MKNILEGPRVQVAHRRRLLVGRQLGRIWLIAWIVVAAALIGRSLWSSGPPAKHVADAAPHSGAAWNDSSRLAEPDQSPSRYQFRAIEELRVGDRVVSDNPDVASSVETAVDPQTWRLLRLYAEESWPDGTLDTIHVETLQSPEWVEQWQAQVGAEVLPPVDLVEMGLPEDLVTKVVANEPCPPLSPHLPGDDPGRLVLTTVNHLNADVWELAAVPVRGPPADAAPAASPRRETLCPTGLHKFYSETRRDWVATKDLHDNEVIRGRAGSLQIVARRALPGVQRVYNLTVEGEHVYYVSQLGLLAHNTCSVQARDARGKFLSLNGEIGVAPGIPFQQRVLESLGVKRANGNGVTQISTRRTTRPDLPIGKQFGVTEIKDEFSISLNPQLRAQAAAAATARLPFNIIISPRTQVIYGPVQRVVNKSGGRFFQFDDAAGVFSPVNFNGNRVVR